MAKVRLIGQRAMNKKVAPLDPVQDAVENAAERIKAKAESSLAAHRQTGEHRIEMTKNLNVKYGYLDYEVALVGEAAMSVEFGHNLVYMGNPTNTYVEGLYIITKASGLA